jgi:hypothetical protein
MQKYKLHDNAMTNVFLDEKGSISKHLTTRVDKWKTELHITLYIHIVKICILKFLKKSVKKF